MHLRTRREVLPAQQEADEVGGRDRLDLAAQAADGQAMDACEDPPVAPLALSRAPVSRRRGSEPAAQHLSLALETRQAGLDEGRRQREPLGHRRRRHRPRRLEPSPQQLRRRGLPFRGAGVADVRQFRLDGLAGIEAADEPEALGGHPQGGLADPQHPRPPRRGQVVEPERPLRHRRQRHERQQRVVKLVGVAHHRPALAGDGGDGRGVEGAHAARVGAQRAPQLHRARPALLERRVVEKCVGIGVENLVAEGRRLRRVDGAGLDGARLDAREHRAQPVEVHRLVQAVAHRLVDERVVGNADVAGEVLLAGDLVGEHRGEEVV